MEGSLYTPQKSIIKINQLYDTLLQIFDMAEKQNLSTAEVALQLAEQKLHEKQCCS
jgi:hypothetical protein